MRAWNLRGNGRDESAAKENKLTQRPPAWVWTRGAHRTMETVCAFTALAHSAHIYWVVLRGAGPASALRSVPPDQGPWQQGQARQKESSHIGL